MAANQTGVLEPRMPPGEAEAELQPVRGSVFYDPPGTPEATHETERISFPMGLPRRLAFLTALMAVLLVLGATEIALSWSARTRLEDFRLETVALANTLASLLVRAAPTGNPTTLEQSLEGWARHRITESQATVYVRRGSQLIPTAASGASPAAAPGGLAYRALAQRNTEVRLLGGNDPGWQVVVPLARPRMVCSTCGSRLDGSRIGPGWSGNAPICSPASPPSWSR